MKTCVEVLIGILFLIFCSIKMNAQNINIIIPAENILNHTEFITVQTVMNTQGNRWWQWDYLPRGSVYPTVRAIQTANFVNTSKPGAYLPASVLQWRLASIGGKRPPFKSGDVWPGFKNFSTSNETWFEPIVWNEEFPPGDINFTFKISSEQLQNNVFPPGKYTMEIIQNYGVAMPNGNGVIFTPYTFYVNIIVPETLSWITANHTAYKEINSLNEFRATPSKIIWDLGDFKLGNTIDFNLFAKSSSSTIQFTSSNGSQGTLDMSILKLGGDHPKIRTVPLSPTWKNLTSDNPFTVENGNTTNFKLNVSLSQAHFKTHFFHAGSYNFQVNLNAKSTGNSTASHQNIDFTLKVPPLSEITIPTSGDAVNFEFNTVSHYSQEHFKVIPNQIRLSNNESYELYVKSDTAFFKRSGIQSDVPSSILRVGVEGRSENVSLAPSSKKIVTNGTPVLDKNFNIKYTIPLTAAQSLVGKEKSTYSINVIYSFTAL